MLCVDFFVCGALMLCCTRMCVALIPRYDPRVTGDHPTTGTSVTGDGLDMINAAHTSSTKTSSGSTVSRHVPNLPPCFVDDVFTELHDGVADSDELSNQTLTLFGICTGSANSSASVLTELAKESSRSRRHGLEVLHLSGELLSEGGENGPLTLTFDLPHSHSLKSNPVLLFAFEIPLPEGNLEVTFISRELHPSTQTVCISGETQYIVLAGKEPEGKVHHKWRISAETNPPNMKQMLKDIFIGGKSGGSISMTPLLLFSGERRTETRYTHASGSSLTSSFLCELKQFLRDVLPQSHPRSSPFQLDSLQSLPPLTLGLSSSETLLAGLIHSSALTIFSFSSWGSRFQGLHGELSLSPALLEELRQKLEQAVEQIKAVIREEDVGHRATGKLEKLKEYSVFPKTEPAPGGSQYCAFLLLKALQTVSRAYEVQNRLRATRADPNNPMGDNNCSLRSLTVSLERFLLSPDTANINNCHGSCASPQDKLTNHAALLNHHIGGGNVDERAPCCVPVAYEQLYVVEGNKHGDGTHLTIRPDVVATECGCR